MVNGHDHLCDLGCSEHAANYDERCYSISGDNTTIVLGGNGWTCVFRFVYLSGHG